MAEHYYRAEVSTLMRSFERTIKDVTPLYVERYGAEVSQAIVDHARQEYERLIPVVPYIGGRKNRWTANLRESVQILALRRAMQACGKTLDESVGVLYEVMQQRLARYPGFVLRLIGRLQFSRLFLKSLQQQAAETRKGLYPGNFAAEIVIGDGREFDWGIDFTKCAIYEFYKAQNALDLLPYVCRIDYLTSAAMGLGLARTKTLAHGDERCNARLKRNRETIWNEQSV